MWDFSSSIYQVRTFRSTRRLRAVTEWQTVKNQMWVLIKKRRTQMFWMFLVHSNKWLEKWCRVELFHRAEMLKRDFHFNCSNNVIITIGIINIIVLCFMLKCDTHVVTCQFPFLFTTAEMFAIFNMIDVTY